MSHRLEQRKLKLIFGAPLLDLRYWCWQVWKNLSWKACFRIQVLIIRWLEGQPQSFSRASSIPGPISSDKRPFTSTYQLKKDMDTNDIQDRISWSHDLRRTPLKRFDDFKPRQCPWTRRRWICTMGSTRTAWTRIKDFFRAQEQVVYASQWPRFRPSSLRTIAPHRRDSCQVKIH